MKLIDLLGTPQAVRVGRTLGTVLIVLAVASNGIALRYAINADSQQREGRRIGIITACRADEALTATMRAILNNALTNARDTQRARNAKQLYRDLFKPLGGLDPLTPQQQQERCLRRVDRALNP